MKKSDSPITVEENFVSSRGEVWKAITELDQMHKWFFENIPDFKPEIGFETEFNVKSGERIFPHKWKIIDLVPGRLITYNWKYEGYKGDSNVCFELTEEDKITKLKVTCEILEDFSEDIPEFTRKSCLNGWKYFINKNLKNYLE